ncbi:hypothetical protein EG68_12138 [Paragonimus skrjabini miyazakii]|uniref:Uncharacterized protein n=1 Tax=Paragonimus skrjabini miyazakii TaxID=59628 RepID=A0A8S9YMZ7_9TREM|nr:hypothetical protein EG68_12138 [Paragonimus skrjabini miyazakii]
MVPPPALACIGRSAKDALGCSDLKSGVHETTRTVTYAIGVFSFPFFCCRSGDRFYLAVVSPDLQPSHMLNGRMSVNFPSKYCIQTSVFC